MQYVLFLGNGINRAFNGDSWDNLIKKISTKYESSLTADDVEHLPFPMKVVALSGDRVIATVKLSAASFRANTITILQPVQLTKCAKALIT